MAYAMELNDDPNASLGGALSFTVFSVVFVVVAILVFDPCSDVPPLSSETCLALRRRFDDASAAHSPGKVLACALPTSISGTGTWIRQRGTLLRGERWLRCSAEQRFDAGDVGFDWKARVHMGPLGLTVRDSLSGGEGGLDVYPGVRVASSRGPAMAQAQVQRPAYFQGLITTDTASSAFSPSPPDVRQATSACSSE